MQVATAIHDIRVFKAEKQQNPTIKMRGEGGGIKLTKGFLSVRCNTVSFPVSMRVKEREREKEGHTDRESRGVGLEQ